MLLPLLLLMADPVPEPEDVKAGWGAFALFLLLIAAVAVLGFSLVKHLRKAEAAKAAGLFGDQPVDAAAGRPDEVGDDGPSDRSSSDGSSDESSDRGPGSPA